MIYALDIILFNNINMEHYFDSIFKMNTTKYDIMLKLNILLKYQTHLYSIYKEKYYEILKDLLVTCLVTFPFEHSIYHKAKEILNANKISDFYLEIIANHESYDIGSSNHLQLLKLIENAFLKDSQQRERIKILSNHINNKGIENNTSSEMDIKIISVINTDPYSNVYSTLMIEILNSKIDTLSFLFLVNHLFKSRIGSKFLSLYNPIINIRKYEKSNSIIHYIKNQVEHVSLSQITYCFLLTQFTFNDLNLIFMRNLMLNYYKDEEAYKKNEFYEDDLYYLLFKINPKRINFLIDHEINLHKMTFPKENLLGCVNLNNILKYMQSVTNEFIFGDLSSSV